MAPAELLKTSISLLVIAPIPAAILAFKGPPGIRRIARYVLLLSWLAYGAAVLVCLWLAFGRRPSSGIGNQVLVLVAIPLAAVGAVWLTLWRAARRHDYVQSLPTAERAVEELADIERGIEGATKNLAAAERRVSRWGISSEERERLRFEISTMKSVIAQLESERAKRR
jgi:hypothetical protein